MGQPVVHFEVNGRDGKKLQQFYSELFGWKIDANNPFNYGLVNTDSNGKGIDGGIGQWDQGPAVIVYAEVDDLQAYLDRAEALGGKTIMKPDVVPGYVALAMFEDPEGNRFGLIASQTPPAE